MSIILYSKFVRLKILVLFVGFLWAAPSLTMAKFSGNPSLYYSKYPWNELGTSVFNPTAQDHWETLGWDECSWDGCGDGCNGDCNPPDSNSAFWDQLDNSQKEAAETLGFEETSWNAPSASTAWIYRYPLEDYFRNYKWSSMLSYERDLFTCLGWNEAIFNDHNSNTGNFLNFDWTKVVRCRDES